MQIRTRVEKDTGTDLYRWFLCDLLRCEFPNCFRDVCEEYGRSASPVVPQQFHHEVNSQEKLRCLFFSVFVCCPSTSLVMIVVVYFIIIQPASTRFFYLGPRHRVKCVSHISICTRVRITLCIPFLRVLVRYALNFSLLSNMAYVRVSIVCETCVSNWNYVLLACLIRFQ